MHACTRTTPPQVPPGASSQLRQPSAATFLPACQVDQPVVALQAHTASTLDAAQVAQPNAHHGLQLLPPLLHCMALLLASQQHQPLVAPLQGCNARLGWNSAGHRLATDHKRGHELGIQHTQHLAPTRVHTCFDDGEGTALSHHDQGAHGRELRHVGPQPCHHGRRDLEQEQTDDATAVQ